MKAEVCCGARCTMMGANGILDGLEELRRTRFPDGGLDIVPIHCTKVCKGRETEFAPVVYLDGELMMQTSLQEVCTRILDAREERA